MPMSVDFDRLRALLARGAESDDLARAALFDGTDAELATVDRDLDSAAQREAFAYNGWDGFDDARLASFTRTVDR
jgi:hypothetical protein